MANFTLASARVALGEPCGRPFFARRIFDALQKLRSEFEAPFRWKREGSVEQVLGSHWAQFSRSRPAPMRRAQRADHPLKHSPRTPERLLQGSLEATSGGSQARTPE